MAGWGRLQQMCGRWQDTNGGARCVNQFEYVRIRTNRSPAIYATLITRHLPMASIDSFMRERRRYHEPRRYAAQRQRQGRRSSSRSEEHTSELQSLMRNSYAVFCLKKKTNISQKNTLMNIQRRRKQNTTT